MKIFQFCFVFNSCLFMSVYFLTFLLLRYSLLRSALICAAATMLSMLPEIARIHYAFNEAWPKVIVTLANILTLQITAILLAKRKDSYTIFIGFSSSIFVLAGNVSSCAVFLISQNPFAAMVTSALINFIVFLCMNYMIKDICKNLVSRESSFWICVIPAMCYITFYLMLYFPVSFEQNPTNMYAAGSLLVTVVVLYILLMQYISAKSSQKRLLWRNRELHAYIRGIELQTNATQAAIQDFRIMRHDMRHKDHLLMELLRDKKYREAEQMLDRDIAYLEQPYLITYCENIIMNSLLYGMAKQAETMKIHLHVSCSVPKQQQIDDFDLAILTANLLENAIQATSKLDPKQRRISLTLKNRNGESFFLEMQNTCSGSVLFCKKTGLPLSKKGGDHGIGMLSVKEFVAKYHAQFDCYLQEQTFIVRILIPLSCNAQTT